MGSSSPYWFLWCLGNHFFTNVFRSRSSSSRLRLRNRSMFDLLLSLCFADLLVGLVTIPVDLILETDLLNRPALCYSALFVSQGKPLFLRFSLEQTRDRRTHLLKCDIDEQGVPLIMICSALFIFIRVNS